MSLMLTERIRAAARAFILGSANVEPWMETWGLGNDQFAPPPYVSYLASSNPVYACATLRADLLGSLPLRVLDGEKNEVQNSGTARLFKHVNPHWTYNRFIRQTELSLGIWGQSFAFLNRGVSGQLSPSEMWWARGDRVRPVPDDENYIAGFMYEPVGSGDPQFFTPQETFWLRHPNLANEYLGLSNLAAARLGADLVSASAKSNMNMFKQGMHIGGVVYPANKAQWGEEEAKAFQRMLSRRLSGSDGAHRWVVLRQEASFNEMGVSPKDAEWIAGMNWGLEDVARALRIPIDLLGGERRTYENFDTALKALWILTVIPESRFISEEIVEQIVPMFPADSRLVESVVMDTTGVEILQEDRTEIVGQIDRLVQRGVPLNVALREVAPQFLPDDAYQGDTDGGGGFPWGNAWWAPYNLAPVSGTGLAAPAQQPPQPQAQEEEPRSFRAMTPAEFPEFGSPTHARIWRAFERQTRPWEARFGDKTAAIMQRQRNSIMDRLNQRSRTVDDVLEQPFERERWVREFREEMRPEIAAIVEEFGQGAIDDLQLDQFGVDFQFDLAQPEAQRFIEARAQRFAIRVNETTWEALRNSISEALAEGESTAQIAERVEQVMAWRIRSSKETIARTEVNGASNGGLLQGWGQTGGIVTGKRWLSALIQTTRDNHEAAHGQLVALGADFVVGRGSGPHPGAIGLEEEDINCLCTMLSELDISGLQVPIPEA